MKRNRLLSRPEAARLLGLSERTIYTLTRSGRLPVLRVGRVYRYRPQDLQAWAEAVSGGSEAEPEALAAPTVDLADTHDRPADVRLLAGVLAELREVRRTVVRIGNRFMSGGGR